MVQEALKEFFKMKPSQDTYKRRDAKYLNSTKTTHHLRDMQIKNRMALITMSKSKSSPVGTKYEDINNSYFNSKTNINCLQSSTAKSGNLSE